jgi:hypothetical protein
MEHYEMVLPETLGDESFKWEMNPLKRIMEQNMLM